MMKLMELVGRASLIFLIFQGHPVLAGNSVGNGGDAVVCRNSEGAIEWIDLLDYYEARVVRGLDLYLGDVPLFRQELDLLLARLERVSAKRARQYRAWTASFESEARFLKNIQLVDVPDSLHYMVPKGCGIEQVVIQLEPRFPEDPRYIVDANLWGALSDDARAGLVMHEAIYREALSYGHENSIPTRYFNAYLAADKFASMTPEDLERFWQSIGFPSH